MRHRCQSLQQSQPAIYSEKLKKVNLVILEFQEKRNCIKNTSRTQVNEGQTTQNNTRRYQPGKQI